MSGTNIYGGQEGRRGRVAGGGGGRSALIFSKDSVRVISLRLFATHFWVRFEFGKMCILENIVICNVLQH